MNRAQRTLMSWDLSQIIAYLLRTRAMDSRLIAGAVREYRRYLMVRADLRLKDVPLGAPLVDKVWHAHILHLEDYEQMCLEAFGQLQYHRPYPDEEWERRKLEYAEVTLGAYTARFGDPNPLYWPHPCDIARAA